MMLAEFETLLKQTMGLDAASIGTSAIERGVQQRRTARHLRDDAAYWELVRSSESELQELIEAVVVPETWFFRDKEAFAALSRWVYEEWLRTHPEGVLRLLSLPCSTGEEPYSMAMALLDARFPAARFRIDAVDISARALAHAQKAIYGRNSFRGGDLAFRDRHFQAVTNGWKLSDAVQEQVQFRQENLLKNSFLPGAEVYDFIFCRNLLIYFDRATQDRAVGVLSRLLTPKGFLFVGPSETGLLLSHDFVSAKAPLAFALRKAATEPRETKTVSPTPFVEKPAVVRVAKVPASVGRLARTLPFNSRPVPSATAVAEPKQKTSSDLDEALTLADQGRLVEAAKLCEESLRAHGPSAKAFYLLGLTRDAAGSHADAVGLYRKALYLDPDHHESLLQLSFLLEKRGEAAGAKVLQDRVHRLKSKRAK